MKFQNTVTMMCPRCCNTREVDVQVGILAGYNVEEKFNPRVSIRMYCNKCKEPSRMFQIDDEMVPFISTLIQMGIQTEYCCSGFHNGKFSYRYKKDIITDENGNEYITRYPYIITKRLYPHQLKTLMEAIQYIESNDETFKIQPFCMTKDGDQFELVKNSSDLSIFAQSISMRNKHGIRIEVQQMIKGKDIERHEINEREYHIMLYKFSSFINKWKELLEKEPEKQNRPSIPNSIRKTKANDNYFELYKSNSDNE